MEFYARAKVKSIGARCPSRVKTGPQSGPPFTSGAGGRPDLNSAKSDIAA